MLHIIQYTRLDDRRLITNEIRPPVYHQESTKYMINDRSVLFSRGQLCILQRL